MFNRKGFENDTIHPSWISDTGIKVLCDCIDFQQRKWFVMQLKEISNMTNEKIV